MQPLRPQGHLAPPRLTTMWPISPAAPRPSQGLPSRIEPAADAGAPEDADQALELAPGAEVELGLGRDLDVVADPDLGAERLLRASRRAGSCPPSRAGCGRRRRRRSSRRRRRGSRPRRPPGRAVSTPACLGRLAQRRRHRRRRRPAGPPLVGVGRRASPSTSPPASTIAVWILVPPRSMPPRSSPRAHAARESTAGRSGKLGG